MNSNKKINFKKIALFFVAALIILAGLLIYAVSWRGSTKDIEAVADSFKPLDGWRQTDSRIVPPQFLCLMGNCPEVYKSWEYKNSIGYEDIKKFVNHDRLLGIDDRCKANNLDVCEFNGRRNGYQYRIHVAHRGDVTSIGLSVRKGGFIDNIN